MRRRRSPWVVVGILAAVLVAVNVGLRELDQRTRSPGGPASSSFATAPDGVAAYAELLRRFDVQVLRLREPLEETELDPATTLVLLEPDELTGADGRSVRSFLESGGRLVAGGDPAGWLDQVIPRPPIWGPSAPGDARAVGVADADAVHTAGEGAWEEAVGIVLVEAGGRPVVLERHLGQGTAILVADPSPLQNRLLGEADNAALALALAGERPVLFAEHVHGYGPASGLGAIPERWWWAFGGLALAALLFALASGRRLGPAELPSRELPPARVEYAEALASQLVKLRPREDAVQAARRVARARVVNALGLPPDASDAELGARAAMRGFDPDAVEAVLGSGGGQEDLLAVGHALRVAEREEVVA